MKHRPSDGSSASLSRPRPTSRATLSPSCTSSSRTTSTRRSGACGQTPDGEKQLRRQLVKAKELRAETPKENDRLQAHNEALVGPLHQVVMENRQLRLQLA